MYFKHFTRLFLLIGIMSFLSVPLRADEIQILGTGTGTQTDYNLPSHSYYKYSLTQQIYTATEIEEAGGGAGTINSIAFYNGGSTKTRNFSVYLVNTDKESFSNNSDWITVTANDLVFSGNVDMTANVWTTLTFSKPFSYDGGNLAVVVDDNTGNDVSGMACRIFTASSTQSIYYRNDSTNPDPTNPTITGTPTTYKNQIILDIDMVAVTCAKPKNFDASNVTAHTATLTWQPGAEGQSNWEVYVTTTATEIPDANTTPTYQVTTCSQALSGLTAQTTYHAYVRANCGDGDKSKWASKTFTTTREALTVNAATPYTQDFETNNDWGFTNGDLTNQWCWGSATNNGGAKAMYVSKDGGTTYQYTNNSTTVVFASKLFNFEQGTYTFVFDWMANGESNSAGTTHYDYLRAVLVPGDMEFTAGTQLPSGLTYSATPTTWIALDGGHQLDLATGWQTQTAEATVSGTYTMVFIWRNDSSGGNQPPAAIDNISISMPSCPNPGSIVANNITAHTATLSWTKGGSEEAWILQYATNADLTADLVEVTEGFVINGNNITYNLTGLTGTTTYYVKVKAVCGDDEESDGSKYNFSTEVSCVAPTLTVLTTTRTAYSVDLQWTGNTTANQFEVAYSTTYNFNPDGTEANGVYHRLIDVTPAATQTWTLDGLNPETTYRIRVRAICGGDDGNSDWSSEKNVTTLATCVAPSGLTATATATTINLSWTAGEEGQDAWDIRYKTGTNDYTIVHLDNQTSTNYTITGLSPVTTYSVNVRAYCSETDQSKWARTTDLSVTTECAALTLPYTCGFEGAVETSQSSSYPMPKCWTRKEYRGGYTGSYTYYPSVREASSSYPYAHGGNGESATSGKSLHFYKPYTSTDEAAILPEIDGQYLMADLQISFWARLQSSETNKDLAIGVMTDPSDLNTFTEVATITVKDATFQEYTAFFDNYTGNGRYIAIRFNSNTTSYIFVDDVTVDLAPSCYTPKDLEVTETDIDHATLTWTPNGTETTWNIQYKKVSDSEWSEPITVSETTYTLNGLKRGTVYEACVQASCSTDDQSHWTAPVSFTTECGIWPIDAENGLFEDFDDESLQLPMCWDKIPANNTSVWIVNINNAMVNGDESNYGAASTGVSVSELDAYLILPHMHIDGDATLSFDHLFGSYGDYVPSSVVVSTTGIDTADFKHTLWIQDENNVPLTRTNVSLSLANYDDRDIYIAFKYEGQGTSGKGWYVDNVSVSAAAHQTIELTQDWNWFSTNLDITLEDLQTALVEALPNTAITIKSRTTSTRYLPNSGTWRGILNWDASQMYMIQVNDICEIMLEGALLNPAEHPVTIITGPNWIGFPLTENMSLNEALASFQAVNGDLIKSKTGSARYTGNGWRSTNFGDLEPGSGYKFLSNATDERTLAFSANSKSSDRSTLEQHESHWADDFDEIYNNPYEDHSDVIAFVQIDGDFVTENNNWADLEIAAFVGEVCRNHKFIVNNMETYGDPYPVIELPIHYTNSNEVVTFKMFDHSKGIEYDICNTYYLNEDSTLDPITILTGEDHFEQWDYVNSGVVLSFTSPVPTTFTKEIIGYGDGDDHYYLIATPIDNMNPADVDGMITDTAMNYDLYWFNQSEDLEWRNYKEETFNLVSGKGYLYANKYTDTLVFAGTPYEGDGKVTLRYDANAQFPGWNLVGNPFTTTAYIEDGRSFYTMNSDGSEIIVAETDSIAAMEGVFVIAQNDNEAMTFTTTAPDSNGKDITLNISQSRGKVIDRAIVRFGEGSQQCNLPKFQIRKNSTKVYIPENNIDYAVLSARQEGELPVNFKAEKNGTYTLTVSTTLNSQLSTLNLIDNVTGNDIDLLATPSYNFEAKVTDHENRFKLVFATSNTEKNDDFAFISNGELIVNGQGALQIFDALGRQLFSKALSTPNSQLSIPNTPGVYMLRLVTGNSTKTQKIVID